MAGESWKTQTWWSLPVYTGDVSGVCSALYELGGMVVMHDPSGCNSTYNTHDEIRWTQKESLIFLSGLTQLDAITGNDRKLIDDIVAAAHQFHPAFVAIANSPVPWLIGTDFSAICRKVREMTGIPAFHVETNAMHDYTWGAGQAFLELAKMLFSDAADRLSPAERLSSPGGSVQEDMQEGLSGRRIRVNVLGMTPLDFTGGKEDQTLRHMLESEGYEVLSVWAMGDGLENLKRSLLADVNLVVSSTGIHAARWLEETFRIPYAAGIPVGAFSDVLFAALKRCAAQRRSCVPYLEILKSSACSADIHAYSASYAGRDTIDSHVDPSGNCCFAGECVTMGSLAADRILKNGGRCDLIPLTETVKGLIPESAVCPAGEQQIRDVLARYGHVVGDPMLRTACPEGCELEELPHFALSGRIYLDRIRPLMSTVGEIS